MYNTTEILKIVQENQGKMIKIERIINESWVSQYFIYHKKTFKNGKVNFIVVNNGVDEVWTNYDFQNFLGNEKWRLGR